MQSHQIGDIKMIWIKQLYIDEDLHCNFVRCPGCGKGRLCDKAANEKAITLSLQSDKHISKSKASIILKCPKCSARFLVSLEPEE